MKVTIITVVLNRATELEITIKSVLKFAHHDIDYIVIDGGSTDGTVDIVRAYTNHLKYWMSEPDAGVYDAMNKGWALADPESWILFLGAGDMLFDLPKDENNCKCCLDILYGNVKLDKGRVFRAHAGLWLRLYNSLHHQALLIPKQLHPDPPFDLAYPHYADYDFNQRLCRGGARFRFASDLLAYSAPAGLTSRMQLNELTKIIHQNYGPIWSVLSSAGFALVRVLPFLKVLQPIR